MFKINIICSSLRYHVQIHDQNIEFRLALCTIIMESIGITVCTYTGIPLASLYCCFYFFENHPNIRNFFIQAYIQLLCYFMTIIKTCLETEHLNEEYSNANWFRNNYVKV